MDIILFVLLSTLILAVAFGIAWPLLNVAQDKIEAWKDAPTKRKIVYFILLTLIMCVSLIALIIDWFVNMIPATIVFQRLPSSKKELLTDRIRGYLKEMASSESPFVAFYSFSFYQRAYMWFVIYVANKIDRTPHFKTPKCLAVFFK